MSRTSTRMTVRAASAVALLAVPALVTWSLMAGIRGPRRAAVTQVPPPPHVAPRPFAGWKTPPVPSLAPPEPPEPLPRLEFTIYKDGGERAHRLPLRHIERFATWTPSSRARAAVRATVGAQLGSPGLFRNAWCDSGPVCWVIADTQFVEVQGRRVAMVTAAGVEVIVDDSPQPDDCHACSGYVSFFLLSPQRGGRWRIDAMRKDVSSGEYGTPGLARIVALGPSTPGWTLEEWGGGQGFQAFSLRAFAVEGRSIRTVLSTDTGVEEPYDLHGCFGSSGATVKLGFDPTKTDEGFYRLTGERVTWRENDSGEHVVGRAPVTLRYRSRIRSFRGVGVNAPRRPVLVNAPICGQ